MTDLILVTFAAGVLGIGAGGILGVFFGGKSVKSEAIFLSFSAGTMLSLVCFELLLEAGETGGLWPAAAATLAGALCVTWLDYIIDKKTEHRNDFITCEDCEYEYENDEKHEHCDHGEGHVHGTGHHHGHIHAHIHGVHGHHDEHGKDQEHEHEHEHDCSHDNINYDSGNLEHNGGHGHVHHHKKASHLQLFVAGIVMALAIAIHNIPEGMSVGAVYAEEGGRIGPALIVLIVSIVLHNIPEGMAVTVPLITSGMNRGKAALVAALSGVPTVLGAIAGYAIGDMGPMGLTLSLGFAAGSLLYVVFGEVLPQSINLYCSRKTAFAAIVGVVVGMLILGGHSHVH